MLQVHFRQKEQVREKQLKNSMFRQACKPPCDLALIFNKTLIFLPAIIKDTVMSLALGEWVIVIPLFPFIYALAVPGRWGKLGLWYVIIPHWQYIKDAYTNICLFPQALFHTSLQLEIKAFQHFIMKSWKSSSSLHMNYSLFLSHQCIAMTVAFEPRKGTRC